MNKNGYSLANPNNIQKTNKTHLLFQKKPEFTMINQTNQDKSSDSNLIFSKRNSKFEHNRVYESRYINHRNSSIPSQNRLTSWNGNMDDMESRPSIIYPGFDIDFNGDFNGGDNMITFDNTLDFECMQKEDQEFLQKFTKFLENRLKIQENRTYRGSIDNINKQENHTLEQQEKDKIEQNMRIAQIVKGISKRIDITKKNKQDKFEDKMKIFSSLPNFINIASFLKDMNISLPNKTPTIQAYRRCSKFEIGSNCNDDDDDNDDDVNNDKDDDNEDDEHVKKLITDPDEIYEDENYNKAKALIAKARKFPCLIKKRKQNRFDGSLAKQVNKFLQCEKVNGDIVHDDNAEDRFYDDLIKDLLSEKFIHMDIPMVNVDFDTQKMHDELEKKVKHYSENKEGHFKNTLEYYQEFKRKAEKIANILRKRSQKIINRDGFGMNSSQAKLKKIFENSPEIPSLTKLSVNTNTGNSDMAYAASTTNTLQDLTQPMITKNHSNMVKKDYKLNGSSTIDQQIKKDMANSMKKSNASMGNTQKEQNSERNMMKMKNSGVFKKPIQNHESERSNTEKSQNSYYTRTKLIFEPKTKYKQDLDSKSHNIESSSIQEFYLTTAPDSLPDSSPTIMNLTNQIKTHKISKSPKLPELKFPFSNSEQMELDESSIGSSRIATVINSNFGPNYEKPRKKQPQQNISGNKFGNKTNYGYHGYSKSSNDSKFIDLDQRAKLLHNKKIQAITFRSMNTKSLPDVKPFLSPKMQRSTKNQKVFEETKNKIFDFINEIDDAKIIDTQFNQKIKNLEQEIQFNSNSNKDNLGLIFDINYTDHSKTSKLKQNWKPRKLYSKKMLGVFLSS